MKNETKYDQSVATLNAILEGAPSSPKIKDISFLEVGTEVHQEERFGVTGDLLEVLISPVESKVIANLQEQMTGRYSELSKTTMSLIDGFRQDYQGLQDEAKLLRELPDLADKYSKKSMANDAMSLMKKVFSAQASSSDDMHRMSELKERLREIQSEILEIPFHVSFRDDQSSINALSNSANVNDAAHKILSDVFSINDSEILLESDKELSM